MTFKTLFRLASLALPLLLLTACAEEEPITGSSNATVLSGAVFTVTERSVSGGKMVVKGTVKNNGTRTWPPRWIVEGDFYTDQTHTFKLGGTTQSFNFSLLKGETTGFELKFSSTQYPAADYPDFGVRNFRVVQGALQ